MTGLIVIDESGDLGSAGSDYFAMAAIISSASRNLKQASSKLKTGKIEYKFFNTYPEYTHSILKSISESASSVNYVISCKNNPIDKVFVYGNELYKRALSDLIDISLSVLPVKDVSIIIDGNRFISNEELRQICMKLSLKHGKNLKKCYKGISQNEPCLKLVDYVVGSIRMKYEHNNESFYKIIANKITIARRY